MTKDRQYVRIYVQDGELTTATEKDVNNFFHLSFCMDYQVYNDEGVSIFQKEVSDFPSWLDPAELFDVIEDASIEAETKMEVGFKIINKDAKVCYIRTQ